MEFRALDPDEFEVWLDHVSTVFFAGREYFYNHWNNDPWKDFEGIRVAVDEGKIVSTLRVFIRKVFLHGEPVTLGGIGEVSTRSEYRRQGLATQLLKDSIHFMEDRNIAISMLLGSEQIYSAEGWEIVPRYYAKKPIQGSKTREWNVRPANFQDTEEVEKLASIYNSYARKFNGTFVRDKITYWTEWVHTETPQAWVAECDGKIEGYVSVRKGDDVLRVNEFAVSEELFTHDKETLFFDVLLSEVIEQMGENSLVVEYPAPIADGFNTPDVQSRSSTMYRIIQPDALPVNIKKELANGLPSLIHRQSVALEQEIKSHHIFWQTDSF